MQIRKRKLISLMLSLAMTLSIMLPSFTVANADDVTYTFHATDKTTDDKTQTAQFYVDEIGSAEQTTQGGLPESEPQIKDNNDYTFLNYYSYDDVGGVTKISTTDDITNSASNEFYSAWGIKVNYGILSQNTEGQKYINTENFTDVKDNNGTYPEYVNISYTETEIPSDVSLAGYYFAGWYLNGDDAISVDTVKTSGTDVSMFDAQALKETSFTGQLSAMLRYSATFYWTDENGDDTAYTPEVSENQTTVSAPNASVGENKRVAYWAKKGDDTKADAANDDGTYDVTKSNIENASAMYYSDSDTAALYEAVVEEYPSFDPNGGKWSDDTNAVKYAEYANDTYTFTEEPTQEGYTFKGWYVGTDDTQAVVTTYTADTAYKAKWEENTSDTAEKVVFPTTSGSYTYGTKLSKIELVGGSGDGTFAWEDEDEIPNVRNGGCTVIFTPNDSSQPQQKDTVAVDIDRAELELYKKPVTTTIYVNNALSKSKISGGVMQGVDGEEVEGTWSWKYSTTSYSKSGDYDCEAVFTPKGNNYEDYETLLGVTVKKSTSSSSGGSGGGSSSSSNSMIGINIGNGTTYSVTATTTGGGSITPSGVSTVSSGSGLVYNIAPDAGYEIKAIYVDGVKIETTYKYTFSNIKENHTFNVVFGAIEGYNSTSTVTDIKSDAGLDKVNHNAYVNGYNDGSFQPDKTITRGEAAAVICRILNVPMEEGVTYESTFTDVDAGAWYANYVGYIQKMNIVNGYSDNTFRPNDEISRAEYIAILARLEGVSGEQEYNVSFSDVGANHWAKNYIGYACENGIADGYSDGTFKPGNSATRAEIVKMTNIILERNASADTIGSVNVSDYSDVDKSHWAYYQIMEASNAHDYQKNSNGEEQWTAIK